MQFENTCIRPTTSLLLPASYDLPMGFEQTYSTRLDCPPSRGLGLKTKQKVVSYLHDTYATLTPQGISCLVGWYCSKQGDSHFKMPSHFFVFYRSHENLKTYTLRPIRKPEISKK